MKGYEKSPGYRGEEPTSKSLLLLVPLIAATSAICAILAFTIFG